MRRESKEGRKEVWKTALKDYILMPNPHCETGGQVMMIMVVDITKQKGEGVVMFY